MAGEVVIVDIIRHIMVVITLLSGEEEVVIILVIRYIRCTLRILTVIHTDNEDQQELRLPETMEEGAQVFLPVTHEIKVLV